MKMIYKTPQTESICFASLEQLATVNIELANLNGDLGIAGKDF